MSKFCANCGAELNDTDVFCTSCGAKIDVQPAENHSEATQPEITQADAKKLPFLAKLSKFIEFPNFGELVKNPAQVTKLPKKQLFTLGGTVIIAILAIILILAIIFPSPKAVVRKYMRGILNENAKQVVSCMPSFMWEDKEQKETAIEDLEDTFELLDLDEYDKIKFEIKDVNKLSRSERNELESMLKMFEIAYDDFEADSVNVKKAKIVDVKVTVKDGGYTHRLDVSFLMIKYKGQWKVLSVQGLDF